MCVSCAPSVPAEPCRVPSSSVAPPKVFVEDRPGVGRAPEFVIGDTCELSPRDVVLLRRASTIVVEDTCDGDLAALSGWHGEGLRVNSSVSVDLEWPARLEPDSIIITGRIRGIHGDPSPRELEVYTTDFDASTMDPERLVSAILWEDQYDELCKGGSCVVLRNLQIHGPIDHPQFVELASRTFGFDSVNVSLSVPASPEDLGLWHTRLLELRTPGIAGLSGNVDPVELSVEQLRVRCNPARCVGMKELAMGVLPGELASLGLSGFAEPASFEWDLTGLKSVEFHHVEAAGTTLRVSPGTDVEIEGSTLGGVVIDG